MSIKPFFKLLKNDQLSTFTGSGALLKPFYKLVYVAAAKECGLFELLADTPKGFEALPRSIAKMTKLAKLLRPGCNWAFVLVILN